ncbi:MAG: hypothetical protein SGPRY_010412, partial [Prymnesium sp.]
VRRLCVAPLDEKLAIARALSTFAHAHAHSDPLREAGAIEAAVALLSLPSPPGADLIRHLACANQRNRTAAREAGALSLLLSSLTRLAQQASPSQDPHSHAPAEVTAIAAAIRNLSFQNESNRDEIRSTGGLGPLLQIVRSTSGEAAYRAAGALENLAADSEDNARAMVEAGVVGVMKELLVGRGDVDLSQKAARKGRAALFRLIAMDRHSSAAKAAATASKERALLEAAMRHKQSTLAQLQAASQLQLSPPGSGVRGETVLLRCALALLEDDLGARSGDRVWAHAVSRFVSALLHGTEAQVPPPMPVAQKTSRHALHSRLSEKPWSDVIDSRTVMRPSNTDGKDVELAVIVVSARQAQLT